MVRGARPPAPWAAVIVTAVEGRSIAVETSDRVQRVHDVGALEVPRARRNAGAYWQPTKDEGVEQPVGGAASSAPARSELGEEHIVGSHSTKRTRLERYHAVVSVLFTDGPYQLTPEMFVRFTLLCGAFERLALHGRPTDLWTSAAAAADQLEPERVLREIHRTAAQLGLVAAPILQEWLERHGLRFDDLAADATERLAM